MCTVVVRLAVTLLRTGAAFVSLLCLVDVLHWCLRGCLRGRPVVLSFSLRRSPLDLTPRPRAGRVYMMAIGP